MIFYYDDSYFHKRAFAGVCWWSYIHTYTCSFSVVCNSKSLMGKFSLVGSMMSYVQSTSVKHVTYFTVGVFWEFGFGSGLRWPVASFLLCKHPRATVWGLRGPPPDKKNHKNRTTPKHTPGEHTEPSDTVWINPATLSYLPPPWITLPLAINRPYGEFFDSHPIDGPWRELPPPATHPTANGRHTFSRSFSRSFNKMGEELSGHIRMFLAGHAWKLYYQL